MSRIGLKPIPLPDQVRVDVQGSYVTVKGPKGELNRSFHPDIEITLENRVLSVRRPTDQRAHKALHGLTRSLLASMVKGVSEGYALALEIVGTGYRAEMQGPNLVLYLGHSHPITFQPPAGLSFDVPRGGHTVRIQGIDKEVVGEIAARIRRQRPPEPYKGKGVHYAGERVRRKAGKAGKVGK